MEVFLEGLFVRLEEEGTAGLEEVEDSERRKRDGEDGCEKFLETRQR
jgi:hypothetical protein